MNNNQLDQIAYKVEFFNENDVVVDVRTIQAIDYWEACLKGLDILNDDENTALADFNVLLG